MAKTNPEIDVVLNKFDAGGMSRRSFLSKMTALGVTAFVANAVSLSPLGAVKAFAAIGGPEERAWELAKIAAGLDRPHTTKDRDKLLLRIGRLIATSHGIGQHYRIDLIPDATGTKAIGLTWERLPTAAGMLTHPGVYCLRTNELSWDEARLWQTYTMLTDLEAVFRSLKSELGLRPIYHHKEDRAEGHLFITVLAYQAVQAVRRQPKAHGINESWASLRALLAVQQRVTATFSQRDGRTLHVRKATVPEPALQKIYDALGLPLTPGGVKKMTR